MAPVAPFAWMENGGQSKKKERYRVTLVVEYLGWVDLHLEYSIILIGQKVAKMEAHQLGEFPKSKSTKPRYSTTRVTL